MTQLTQPLQVHCSQWSYKIALHTLNMPNNSQYIQSKCHKIKTYQSNLLALHGQLFENVDTSLPEQFPSCLSDQIAIQSSALRSDVCCMSGNGNICGTQNGNLPSLAAHSHCTRQPASTFQFQLLSMAQGKADFIVRPLWIIVHFIALQPKSAMSGLLYLDDLQYVYVLRVVSPCQFCINCKMQMTKWCQKQSIKPLDSTATHKVGLAGRNLGGDDTCTRSLYAGGSVVLSRATSVSIILKYTLMSPKLLLHVGQV